ncbi:MAG: UDP-N-acetylmuramate dehydrogenase [Mycoplasmatota bacterium]
MNIISDLKKLKVGKVVENAKLNELNTYKIGKTVDCVVYPKNINSLIKLMKYLKQNNIKNKIIGKGSNLIFCKARYDGVLIKLDEFNKLKINNRIITVGSGYNLMKLSMKAAASSLTGLEFASGIPGTVGGAVYMNAGAYKSDMGYIVNKIKVLDENYDVKVIYNDDLDFHYRTSLLQKEKKYICLEVTLILKRGTKEAILEVINERKQRRLESQPLEYPSAGSVFRNPTNDYAGRLIENIGYKGKNNGGAKVSEKHANFIINEKNATGKEIVDLIEEIQKQVKKEYDIDLLCEQEIVL